MSRLFRATHLDLLTAGAAAGVVTDAWFLGTGEEVLVAEGARLARFYPQATRVVCADELADGTTLFQTHNPWYDTDSSKSNMSLLHALVHAFIKLLNEVCQKRRFDAILLRGMDAYPAVARYIVLILHCVLLGTLPGARDPLPLAAAMRVTATFATLARPAGYARLVTWIRAHPMLTMALLREYYMTLIEADGVLDTVRSQLLPWQRFKALARHANGECRRTLVAAGDGPLDWAAMEHRRGRAGTSFGTIGFWHECLKEHFVKLRKGSEIELLLKKLKNVEAKLSFDAPSIYAWMRAHGRLEALHTIAWHAAMALAAPGPARTFVMTRWLKALGMTAAGFDAVREWIHGYFDYNVKDNSFCAIARAMHARAPTDFVLLKTYLRCVLYYMNDVLLIDPLPHARAKVQALRTNMAVEPWSSTPDAMGYLCEGCLEWANVVVLPSPALLDMAPEARPAPSRKKPRRPTLPLPVPLDLAHGRAACMRRVYYHPLDTQLYCRRARFAGAAEAAAPDEVAAVDAELEGSDEIIEADADNVDDEEVVAAPGAAGLLAGNHDIECALLATHFSCERPVVAIDLAGAAKRVFALYSRCVYCGMVCQALSVNMTNMGLSCGAHALPDEYPASHRHWRHLQQPVPAIPARRELNVGPCFVCQTAPVTHVLDVYDYAFRFFQLPLCAWHVRHVRETVRLHHANAVYAPPPVRYDHLRLERSMM
jgi:hypothetical protein